MYAFKDQDVLIFQVQPVAGVGPAAGLEIIFSYYYAFFVKKITRVCNTCIVDERKKDQSISQSLFP